MNTNHPIISILERWPDRNAIAADVGKKVIVVHRWFQRQSVPAEYDGKLLDGASRRNIPLNWRELMDARATRTDQRGHAARKVQGQPQ